MGKKMTISMEYSQEIPRERLFDTPSSQRLHERRPLVESGIKPPDPQSTLW